MRQHSLRHIVERDDFIHAAHGHGFLRHAIHDASRFILGKIVSAGLFHFQHAGRAILTHAGENDADRILAGTVGGGAELCLAGGSLPPPEEPIP